MTDDYYERAMRRIHQGGGEDSDLFDHPTGLVAVEVGSTVVVVDPNAGDGSWVSGDTGALLCEVSP